MQAHTVKSNAVPEHLDSGGPSINRPIGPLTDAADFPSPTRDGAVNIDPMTGSLMARLFGVPLIIICVIVGCAVVVVLLFGSLSTDQQRPLESLLSIIEGHVGEKTAGVLLPNEKEVWQVSRELALRLQKKDAELTPEQLASVVDRLSVLLGRYRAASATLSDMGRKQMSFVMRALSLTESPSVIEPLASMLSDGNAETRREALTALATMNATPAIGDAVPAMIKTLQDGSAVVRTTACAALAAVAKPGDERVIAALAQAYFDQEREVRWNAALSLARLGSDKGRSTLLDMLSRAYWKDEVKVRIEAPSGETSEYAMPPSAVERYLVAAIDAASHVSDKELESAIRALASDPSPEVRDTARHAIERSTASTNGTAKGDLP